MFDKPIVVVGKPLVNFALTIQTARSDSSASDFRLSYGRQHFYILGPPERTKSFRKKTMEPLFLEHFTTSDDFGHDRNLLPGSPSSAHTISHFG